MLRGRHKLRKITTKNLTEILVKQLCRMNNHIVHRVIKAQLKTKTWRSSIWTKISPSTSPNMSSPTPTAPKLPKHKRIRERQKTQNRWKLEMTQRTFQSSASSSMNLTSGSLIRQSSKTMTSKQLWSRSRKWQVEPLLNYGPQGRSLRLSWQTPNAKDSTIKFKAEPRCRWK